MTAADILAAALADGVEIRVGANGLHLSGDRAAVARWAGAIRPVRDDILTLLRPDPRVTALRSLLVALLWDAPHEVEPEIESTLADGALDEALAMYRRCYSEYRVLGELPAAAGADAHVSAPTRRMTERWVDGPLPAVFEWEEGKR